VYGEPKENSDLWDRLLSARSKTKTRVDVEWTKGKGSPILKQVDRAVKAGAPRGGLNADGGFQPGKIARSMAKGAAPRFAAKGQTALIRTYRNRSVAKGTEDKTYFALPSADGLGYVGERVCIHIGHLNAKDRLSE